MTDDRYTRVTYHGRTVDKWTRAALQAAEDKLGYELTIVQGSYNTGVGASAGTHDGGGVVDLAAWDHERKVRALREVGFAAWYRAPLPGVWGAHIHAVLVGHGRLAPSAARQIEAYRAGRDGLAGNRVDATWRPTPIPVAPYPPKPPKLKPTNVSRARRRFESGLAALAEGLVLLEKADKDRPVARAVGDRIDRLTAELNELLDILPKR